MKAPQVIAAARRGVWWRAASNWLVLFLGATCWVFGQAGAGGGAERDAGRGIAAAFDSRVVRFSLAEGTDGTEVAWRYVNRWDFPLLVEGFEESCSCLRGCAESEAIEPGESGTIRAVFTAGGRRGLVRKSLHVRFVGHDGAVELVAEANIPAVVELSRRELVWRRGEPVEAQSVELTAGTPSGFRITSLVGLSDKEFEVRQETLEEGRRYRLTITPASVAKLAVRSLQVRTDSPDPRDRIVPLFLVTGADGLPPGVTKPQ